jgi:Sulfotransferase family
LTEGIRIRDLGRPEYSEAGAAAIKAIEETPFEFSVDAIIKGARAECDVSFFAETIADDGTLSRLEEWIRAVEADRQFSRIGRFQTLQYAKRHLIQRSRLEALYAEHPEIDDVQIGRPLIIAGLPRSGTTHLLNLIGADSRLRSLRYWESLEPIPSPAARRGEVPDQRRQNGQAQLDIQNTMMPLFRNMYDVENDGIHEEVELQHMCMSTLLMAATAQVPDWMQSYFARDQRPHYAFMKRAIKALQFLAPRERWVLKSPQHMGSIPALLETFPDATFVVTHRDPVAVFASWATLLTYAARFSRSPIDVRETAEYAQLLMKLLLDRLVRDRDSLPEDRTEHVYFHEFMADDWGTLSRIYERANLSFTDETQTSMKQYLDQHPRGRHGKILYDLKEDFGVDRESVYDAFSNYLEAFPRVRREAPNQ